MYIVNRGGIPTSVASTVVRVYQNTLNRIIDYELVIDLFGIRGFDPYAKC